MSQFEIRPRQALTDDVYDAIKKAILSKQLAPGSKINLDDLSRSLGVSNTPVRQALGRLEAEGLTLKENYRGYTVSDLLNIDRLDSVYQVRLMLEPQASEWAAQKRTDTDLAGLKDILDLAKLKASEGGPLDGEFHGAIARMTGNEVLAEQIVRLQQWTAPFRTTFKIPGYADHAYEEHYEVYKAIADSDPKAANLAMQKHIETSRDRIHRIGEGGANPHGL